MKSKKKVVRGGIVKLPNGKIVKVLDVSRGKYGEIFWFNDGKETRWMQTNEIE